MCLELQSPGVYFPIGDFHPFTLWEIPVEIEIFVDLDVHVGDGTLEGSASVGVGGRPTSHFPQHIASGLLELSFDLGLIVVQFALFLRDLRAVVVPKVFGVFIVPGDRVQLVFQSLDFALGLQALSLGLFRETSKPFGHGPDMPGIADASSESSVYLKQFGQELVAEQKDALDRAIEDLTKP